MESTIYVWYLDMYQLRLRLLPHWVGICQSKVFLFFGDVLLGWISFCLGFIDDLGTWLSFWWWFVPFWWGGLSLWCLRGVLVVMFELGQKLLLFFHVRGLFMNWNFSSCLFDFYRLYYVNEGFPLFGLLFHFDWWKDFGVVLQSWLNLLLPFILHV